MGTCQQRKDSWMPKQRSFRESRLMSELRKERTELDRWLGLAVVIAMIAIAQFVYCCGAAMEAYPGGDYRYDSSRYSSHAYDWNHNWLSDLGRSRTWSGQENSVSARYFNFSIMGMGIGLISSLRYFTAVPMRIGGQLLECKYVESLQPWG